MLPILKKNLNTYFLQLPPPTQPLSLPVYFSLSLKTNSSYFRSQLKVTSPERLSLKPLNEICTSSYSIILYYYIFFMSLMAQLQFNIIYLCFVACLSHTLNCKLPEDWATSLYYIPMCTQQLAWGLAHRRVLIKCFFNELITNK